ncbi:MAG: sigma-54-dependent transcriptional regulator [bacterium]
MPDAKSKILIVDDERHTREGLKRALEEQYVVETAGNGEQGLEILRREHFDVVLTDLRMPGMDGMTFIRRALALSDPPLIVMLTAYGSVQTAVEAMGEGAYDYVSKPVNLDNLEMIIERGLDSRRLREENEVLRKRVDARDGMEGIVGSSPAMLDVLDTVRQVAPSRSTVMLTGESGTGKELVAHAIHKLSPRAGRPFVDVHCASLNPNLLESELFGHERGAFTGAHERQAGRFEKADGGTLFLDEIGEIDGSTQIKLLRVLETRTFERVGGSSPIETDVRLIAATNRDLRKAVDEGQFREDLYFRLNVVQIHMPPLRERPEDLELLLNHFRKQLAADNGRDVDGFTPEAIKVLAAYEWPGNVRELRNCVERMVVMSRGRTLSVGDIPKEIRAAVADSVTQAPASSSNADGGTDANATANHKDSFNINTNERDLIARALKECDGNRTQAAKKLGISRRTLHRKLHSYGLEAL